MGIYVQRVLIAHEVQEAALTGSARGILSDLYPRWYGARELLLHGRDPYSAEVTKEIRSDYYGQALDSARPGSPKDQQAFAYPLYVVFLLAPTVHSAFEPVRVGFLVFLFLLTAASVWLWLRFLEWNLPPAMLAAVLVLSLGNFSAWQGLKLQQLTLLVCALLAAALASLVAERPILAGILLALATIKPQLVAFVLVWLILWTTGHWRERQRWMWSFGATMLALLGGSQFLLPGWLGEFLAAVRDYHRYTGGTSVFGVLLPPGLETAAWTVLTVGLLFVAWRARHVSLASEQFRLTTLLILAGTLLQIPMIAPYNYLLLLPGILWLLCHRERAVSNVVTRVTAGLAALSILWPWLAATGLALGLLVFPRDTILRAWHVPLWTALVIPVTVFAILALQVIQKNRRQSTGEVT
jgi:hypothetical protein